MFYRRRLLLSSLEHFIKLRTEELYALVAHFCKQTEQALFTFIKRGQQLVSFQMERDLEVLWSHYKLIKYEKEAWQLTTKAAQQFQLNTTDNQQLKLISEKFLNKQLVPKLLYKSLITEHAIKANKVKEPIVFSLGYEGLSIDDFLNKLLAHDVKLLCDVRNNPLSMKYGFSKNQLKKYCHEVKISYENIRDLGISSTERKNLQTHEQYQQLFNHYKKTLQTKEKAAALASLAHLAARHKRIALMCFERDNKSCHRSILAKTFKQQYDYNFIHL